ncbi:hypothetical protein PV327_004080 [Microctonus hyperodae]|uniref:THAP-type domain-containing protein n=1 Tax=Microctonus hyperodae TaxID=165561 RepID=A0AA39KMA4_MICHY|nr:hypothetical protein PV327_004080 [Microctonus hyperodae]
MSKAACCVVNCKNTRKNSSYVFFKFPCGPSKIRQREKWILAVKRKNKDGTTWLPKAWDCICSEHFVGKKKSPDPLSPSYAPTIFPTTYKRKSFDAKAALERHERFVARQQNVNYVQASVANNCNDFNHQTKEILKFESESQVIEHQVTHKDQGCQVFIFTENSDYKMNKSYESFTCNLFKNNDAAVQTDIYNSEIDLVKYKKEKQSLLKNKKVGTDKVFVDAKIGPNINFENSSEYLLNKKQSRKFEGYSSIKESQQLFSLTSVSMEIFDYLLKRINDSPKQNVSKEDKLFICLMILKTGISFSGISVLFDLHRTTISKIFHSTLQKLVCATKNDIVWPTKDVVKGTMPKCFKLYFPDTRVIIDCIEFRTEIPKSISNKAFFYSHHKKGFTIKLLVGITPSGYICFISKAAGGQKSDAEITTESGLLDLLEDGDVVLVDKGFSEIKTSITEKEKKITVIMPPFSTSESEFSNEKTEQTHNVASVRIHIQKIMQRLRIFKILDKIPVSLFTCVDDILHLCCILVNLQLPITNEES